MIASLLERGERLVSAVETGLIPIPAMDFKAETEEAQNLLLDAMNQQAGAELAAVRRLLEMDAQPAQGWIACRAVGPKGTGVRRMTAADLMQVYQRRRKSSVCWSEVGLHPDPAAVRRRGAEGSARQ